MWQEITIILVGLLVIIYVGIKFYRLFTQPNHHSSDPCIGCSGCSLKKQLKNKKFPRT